MQIGDQISSVARFGRETCARVVYNSRRQTQAACDFESARGSRYAHKQAIGGPQIFFVEFHRGIHDSGRRGSVGLQAVVVRRGDCQCAQGAEFFEQRDGESRAFFGRGARTHFVDENQRAVRRDLEHRFQIQHVRRKRGEVGGNGLLVTDIGQNVIEERQFGAFRSNGNRRLCSKCSEADVFKGDCLPARVGSADDHHCFRAAKRKGQGDGFAALRAQRVFENRITRGFEAERITDGKFRHRAIELTRKSRTGKNRIEMSDSRGGGFKRPAIGADLFGEFGENACNLRDFFFGKLDEAIIEIDGSERLDEYRLARGAGSVHDARNGAAIAGANRNDEAIVAERDVVLASRLTTCPKNTFERLLDFVARLPDARANAAQLWRSIVADFTIGKNRAADGGEEVTKICKGRRFFRQTRIFRGFSLECLPDAVGRLHQ